MSEDAPDKKRNECYFTMTAHIGTIAGSGSVHTLRGTAAKVRDVVQATVLLHGEETDAFGTREHQRAHERADAKPRVDWHVDMRRCKRWVWTRASLLAMLDEVERLEAIIWAKVGHPFRVI